MNKKRKTALKLLSGVVSVALAVLGALGLQGRVRTVDIIQLFFGGLGAGTVITIEMMERRRRRPNIFPALKYRDGPAAVAWLEKAFGFTKGMEMLGPNGTIAHAELKLGPGILMLGSVGKPDPTNPWPTDAQSLYVYLTDVDAHHARATAAGAKIIREPHDTDYGSHEYSALDLEGRLWSFGTYYPEV